MQITTIGLDIAKNVFQVHVRQVAATALGAARQRHLGCRNQRSAHGGPSVDTPVSLLCGLVAL